MRKIGDLNVKLTGDGKQFAGELEKARKGVQGFANNARQSLNNISFKKLTAGFAAVAGGAAAAIKSTLDYADAIGKAADRGGVATDTIQELRYAFGFAGVSAAETDEAMRRLNRRLGEFANTGGGPAAGAFESLGINVRDANGALRSTDDVLDEAIDKLSRMENQAEISSLSAKLFGEFAGPKMAAALAKGGDAIANLRQEAHDLNTVLDEETIRQAEATNDALSQMGTVIQTQVLAALSKAIPSIQAFVNAFSENKEGIATFITGVVDAAKVVTDFIATVAKGIGYIYDLGEAITKTFFLKGESTLEEKLTKLNRLYADTKRSGRESYETQEQFEQRLNNLLLARKRILEQIRSGEKGPAEPTTITITGGTEAPAPNRTPFVPTPTGSAGGQGSQKSELKQRNEELERQARRWKDLLDPIQKYRDQLNEVIKLEQAGKLTAEESLEARFKINEAMDESIGVTDELTDKTSALNDIGQDVGDTLVDALDNAARSGKDFESVLASLLKDLAQIAVKAVTAGGGLASLFGGVFQPTGTPIMSASGFQQIQGAANGGMIPPNTWSYVGERGTELIRTGMRGASVIPNHALGGSMPVEVNVTNTGTAQQVETTGASLQAGKMVVDVILKDLQGNGPISRAQQRTFGTRRSS